MTKSTNLCENIGAICIWNFDKTGIDVIYVISLQSDAAVIIYRQHHIQKHLSVMMLALMQQ